MMETPKLNTDSPIRGVHPQKLPHETENKQSIDSPEGYGPIDYHKILNLVVLQYSGNGCFMLQGSVPADFLAVYPQLKIQTDGLQPQHYFKFLNQYILEIEAAWESGKDSLNFGPWVEFDASGKDYILQAMTTVSNGRKILVISIDNHHEQRREFYQPQHERSQHPVDRSSGAELSKHADIMALTHALEVAEQANIGKTKFLASISHDLRNSAYGALGFAELGARNVGMLHPETLKSYLDSICDSLRHMLFMLNDLLDLGKIETGHIEPNMKNMDLVELASFCINEQQALFRKYHLDAQLDCELATANCACDRNQMIRVISNLISNAIKFSSENGKIRVVLKQVNNGYRISVSDQGCGIPTDDLDRIFDRYYQCPGQVGGTGLGLAISREIIELHHGRIWAENNAGKGSSILFEIPSGH